MNPRNLFRPTKRKSSQPAAHMTWASRSLSHTVTRTGLFLRKQLWIWPIIAFLILSVVGFSVRSAIESTIKNNVSSGLRTLVDLESGMLQKWFEVHESTAETLANDSQVRQSAYALLGKPDGSLDSSPDSESNASASSLHAALADELVPAMSSHDYVGYFLADKSGRIISSSHRSLIDMQDVPEYESFLSKAFSGETIVSTPFASVARLKTLDGKSKTGVPTMYVCAPVRDASFQVVAALALQIPPEAEFTSILQLGRVGDSGETYAFNADGVMISNSRFDEELILLGLLPDQENSQSMLHLRISNPGGDMTSGYRPMVRRNVLPLTKMAEIATSGVSGLDVDGYQDYRGVPVIGAWSWLPKYQMGVATEVDAAQAFRPLVILQRAFLIVYSLLILSAIAIFVFTVIVAKLQRQAREAVIEAQQLGQYTLEGKLGEGAMGVVYKGHHSMLRRPTAIKLLQADKVDETSLSRFEREVVITCQLNHANTIAIYDFGRTPEGVFYYAMEFLDGIDLQTLVNQYGPQSEARVIHILLQMCGSLYEAHSKDLVHRDIKPANVMLNRRGCEPDVVKVLDFGLVKNLDQGQDDSSEKQGSLAGTPLYMSPESIQAPMSVDARSDLYAVGAVGYFLLTGKPVFEAAGLTELCQKHIDEKPVPPSQCSKVKVSTQLDDAILSCLEKTRAKRPQTARDLAQLFSRCSAAGAWTSELGDRWWGRHERGSSDASDGDATTMDATMDHTMDFNPSEED